MRRDDAVRVGKRSRQTLDPDYVAGYIEQILDRFDLSELLASPPDDVTPVLLCVEAEPGARHRSLIAGRLASQHGLNVVHLRPRHPERRGSESAIPEVPAETRP